jgi:hypothetical protein
MLSPRQAAVHALSRRLQAEALNFTQYSALNMLWPVPAETTDIQVNPLGSWLDAF